MYEYILMVVCKILEQQYDNYENGTASVKIECIVKSTLLFRDYNQNQ